MRAPRRPLPTVLTVSGALILAVALFLCWSHQLPRVERRHFDAAALSGVPANPSALQVYAIAGEVLAACAILCAAAGLWGQRPLRGLALATALLALAFTVHALSVPPTNGLLLAGASGGYVRDPATPGPGETVALVGLGLTAAGLALALVSGPAGAQQRASSRPPAGRSAA